ncbi:MAG: gliding motility-associated C-terminal domain-containing protein, partial [Brumimicrobium sp.]
ADGGGTWSGTGITDANAGTFDPGTAGVGTHTITYTVGILCPETDTYDVVVQALDDPSIDPAGPLCQGAGTVNLTAATTPGTWSGTGITDVNAGTFDPEIAGEGIHTINYITNDVCPNTNDIDIEVFPPLSIEAYEDQTICNGESVTITTDVNGGNGNYFYEWEDESGNILGNNETINVSPTNTTTYTVVLTDDCNTTPVSSTVTITVTPLPQTDFVSDLTSGCAPLSVNFTNTSANSGTSCEWTIDGNTYNDCNPEHTFEQSGCYDISLVVEENGCSDSQTIEELVCVEEMAIADFTYSPDEIDILDTKVDFENYSVNGSEYKWVFGDGNFSSLINPSHEFPVEADTYTTCLAAMTEMGCNDTVCVDIVILDELLFFVPNTFTPDGDSFNEQFQAVFTSGYDPQNFHMMIFNRWGEVIWESFDANAKWDGTYGNGEIVQDGVYVWKIEFKTLQNDNKITRTGHLNVIR